MLDGNLRPAANLPLIGYTSQAAGQEQSRAKYLHIFTFAGRFGVAAVKAQFKVPTLMRKLTNRTHKHTKLAVALKVA